MWQYIIPAASNLIGGLIASGDKKAAQQQDWQVFQQQQAFQKEQFENQKQQQALQQENLLRFEAAQAAQNKRNEEVQREFAQSGVQWRVADAVKAGLHPLAALGASTASGPSMSISAGPGISTGGVSSVSPPRASGASPMGAAFAGMGQDLSRAMMASAAQDTREMAFNETSRALQVQNMTLKNDLLASQLQRIKQGSGPPGPDLGLATEAPPKDKVTERGRNVMGNVEVRTHPGWSQTQGVTDEYGEGVADWIYGPAKAFFDWMYHNSGATSVAEYRAKNARDKFNARITPQPLGRR